MKRTIALILAALLSYAQSPTEADISELFSARSVLQIKADQLEQTLANGYRLALDRIREAQDAAAAALITIQTKLDEQAAVSKQAAAAQAATTAELDAIKSTLKALQSQPGVTTQQVIDALVAKLSAP
jgi:restriction endonuclease Mrr